jgi:hypothetical protein
MAGRATTLADAIVAALTAWGDLPAGCTVSRVRSVTHLIKDMPDDAAAQLAVIVSEVEDQSSRADVAEDCTIGFAIIANCNSEAVADSDAWDELTEKLRDYLRINATFKNISLGGSLGAQRKSVSTVVVCDADMLDRSEVFVSVTEGVWFISVANRG